MKTVFLDTGYVIALELSSDQNHFPASQHWRKSLKSLPLLLTTTYVFDEIVTFFNNRGHHEKAVDVGNRLLNSPSVQLVHVDEVLFQNGWLYFQKHKDKEYSLTDCISFVLMNELGIKQAFAFDRHFVQAGFKRVFD